MQSSVELEKLIQTSLIKSDIEVRNQLQTQTPIYQKFTNSIYNSVGFLFSALVITPFNVITNKFKYVQVNHYLPKLDIWKKNKQSFNTGIYITLESQHILKIRKNKNLRKNIRQYKNIDKKQILYVIRTNEPNTIRHQLFTSFKTQDIQQISNTKLFMFSDKNQINQIIQQVFGDLLKQNVQFSYVKY